MTDDFRILDCHCLSLILRLFKVVKKLLKMVWKCNSKTEKEQCLHVMVVSDFYSYKDNNNNALNQDKMWASLLEDSFKFGISSLVKLHTFIKSIFTHSLCILIRSDVIYMIMWRLGFFYILSYVHLTWSWVPEVQWLFFILPVPSMSVKYKGDT